jgi:transposase
LALHGVNERGEVVLRRELRRQQLGAFFQKLEPTEVVLEACGGSHHWGRTLAAFGHRVKLIAPQYVKPFVKRSKNDRIDAEAISEAASRPAMRFVPVKSAAAQAEAMILSVRELLVKQHTQLVNALRGHAAEFGVIAAKGTAHVAALLERIAADPAVPVPAQAMFAELGARIAEITTRLAELDRKLAKLHRANPVSRQLAAGRRTDQCADAGTDDRCEAVQLGAALRRLARSDAKAERHRRQAPAGQDLAPGQ